MKYDLSIDAQCDKALDYLNNLIGKKALVEIVKVNPKRSLNQNAYLHVLCGAYGMHFGLPMDQAKAIYKWANKNIYYKKFKIGDEAFLHIRSSADLDDKEMAASIDKFMLYSEEQGFKLPPATNKDWIMDIQNQMEREGYKYR